MIIRKAQLKDIEQLEKIALKTGDSGSDASNYFYYKNMISKYYCEPYIHFDDSLCFVAIDNNECIAYIVACENTNDFYNWFNLEWKPECNKLFNKEHVKSDKEANLLSLFSKEAIVDYPHDYPAHLHINICIVGQGKGLGKTLVNTVVDELKKRNIKGIHLGVDIHNKGAIGFYKHIGFKSLFEDSDGILMGLNIN